jgi:hypothetical protein
LSSRSEDLELLFLSDLVTALFYSGLRLLLKGELIQGPINWRGVQFQYGIDPTLQDRKKSDPRGFSDAWDVQPLQSSVLCKVSSDVDRGILYSLSRTLVDGNIN